MTKENIITVPDPRLKQRSQKVTHIDANTLKLIEDMTSATLDWGSSRPHEVEVALAAVQIGDLRRVVIVREDFENRENKKFKAFINPEIVKFEGEPEEDMEVCLSVSDVYGKIARYPKVKVKAQDINGAVIRATATGFLARVFQHEIDHTNGIVFLDRLEDNSKLMKLEADGSFAPMDQLGQTS